jgi:nucleoside-diphosphate-sugar epimerase
VKVAVIGSGGYIGRNLVLFLKKREFDVEDFSSSDGNCINPTTGILSENFSVPPGTNAIIYLAQSPFYRQVPDMSWHLWNVNVTSAVRIAEMARKAKVERFIYASTGNVYAPSFNPLSEASPLRRDNWYSLSKIHAEEALSLYGNDLNLTIMRIFGVYGPGQTDKLVPNLLNSALHEKDITIDRNPENSSDLNGLKISLCYIDDIVEIMSSLISQGGPPILNIAGNEAASLRQLVNEIGLFLDNKLALRVTDRYRQGEFIADISLLKSALNPQFTSLKHGLKKTIEQLLYDKR